MIASRQRHAGPGVVDDLLPHQELHRIGAGLATEIKGDHWLLVVQPAHGGGRREPGMVDRRDAVGRRPARVDGVGVDERPRERRVVGVVERGGDMLTRRRRDLGYRGAVIARSARTTRCRRRVQAERTSTPTNPAAASFTSREPVESPSCFPPRRASGSEACNEYHPGWHTVPGDSPRCEAGRAER